MDGAIKPMFMVFTEKITKRTVTIFECMEISETIYEGLLEPYYKQTTR